jgi:hypothetical protein
LKREGEEKKDVKPNATSEKKALKISGGEEAPKRKKEIKMTRSRRGRKRKRQSKPREKSMTRS